MSSEAELNALRRWLDIKKRRGHAHMWAWETSDDLVVVERVVAGDFARAAYAKWGREISSIRSNPQRNGVPDCYATEDAKTISIALTEFVDGSLVDHIRAARAEGFDVSAFSATLFERAQWDAERFEAELLKRLTSKSAKYVRNNEFVDLLVIYADEPWLMPTIVEQWLDTITVVGHPTIGSAYLLMSYFPGYSEACPVFQLY